MIQTLNLSDAINPPQGSAYEIEDIIVNTSLDSGKTNVKASRNNRIFEDDLSDAAFLFDRADLRSQMILSHNTASYKQTDTYEMFGNIYSVVGFASENYITYNEFYDLNLSVNFFRVVLKSKPTTQQKKEFTQLLTSRFPECRVKNADFYMEQDREITVQAIGVMTMKTEKAQVQAAQKISALGLSVRQAELLAKRLSTEQAPKKKKDVDDVDYTAEAQKDLASRLGRGVKIVTGKKKGRIDKQSHHSKADNRK